MKSSVTRKEVRAIGLIVIGVAIGFGGVYVGETADAPGAAIMGAVLMIGAMTLGVRTARRAT